MKMSNAELCRWVIGEVFESADRLPTVGNIDKKTVEDIKARLDDLPMFSPNEFLKSLYKTEGSIYRKIEKVEKLLGKIKAGSIESHIPAGDINAYLRSISNDAMIINFVSLFVKHHYNLDLHARPLSFRDIERLLSSSQS